MMRRTPFKRHAPKKRGGHDKAMLTACKGELCYLRIPGVCIGGTETVVPCHANWSAYGKGMGLKAKDEYTVPGCLSCHQWLDQGPALKQIKRDAWESAYQRWAPAREMKL